MKLCFDSIEEVKIFVGSLKGTRGGKKDDGEPEAGGQATTTTAAPPPLQPPAGGVQGFQPAGGFTSLGGAFPAPGAGPSSHTLVQRINVRLDGALASGQPADQALAWLRSQLGPEAANATMEQCKATLLPKASMPTLENIAKLMAA